MALLGYLMLAIAALIFMLAPITVGDKCASGSVKIAGNWYCEAVTAIRYSNVGAIGSYKQVTEFREDNTCATTSKDFSGPLAPLNEEISAHFRGPFHLHQFAVYTPKNLNVEKRTHQHILHRHRHHTHLHGRSNEIKFNRRAEEDMVTATIDGQVVSWTKNYHPESATPITSPRENAEGQLVTATIDGQVVSWVNNWHPETLLSQQTSKAVTSSSEVCPNPTATPTFSAASTGAESPPFAGLSSKVQLSTDSTSVYERIGYYNAASQVLDNLVFLGNYGGQGSGSWSPKLGNSLSYINSDATGGSPSPQVLQDMVVPSNHEFTIMLAKECTEGDCGVYRPGSVAYHGFDGANKVFLMEFTMPQEEGNRIGGQDMPAMWFLNANIPRTVQYGGKDCSCWNSGCGEFDVVEALHPGSTFLKSTFRAKDGDEGHAGGDSDYVARPMDESMKLAIVFQAATSTIHIQVLPQDTDFATTLTGGEIDNLCSTVTSSHISLFDIA